MNQPKRNGINFGTNITNLQTTRTHVAPMTSYFVPMGKRGKRQALQNIVVCCSIIDSILKTNKNNK